MEFITHYGKKVIWEVVDNHIIEDPSDHNEIVIRVFDFNFSDKYEKGVGR